MSDALAGTAKSAVKWSLITEMIAKIIIPITQLVLARILAPEAFGILATVVMIVSFAEMISDAGFQKYLIQYEFEDEQGLFRAASVAFWASMGVATTLMLLVILFRDALASMVGAPGLGIPLAVAALSLPLSVLVSTQQALFRRAFEYKRLLPIRVAVAAVPLVVSVPLALIGWDYWSLIVGVLTANLLNAVAMTAISHWKPGFSFSWQFLRKMLGFSVWSLLEAVLIWMTVWSGTFIVGNLLTAHELGLYRQPILVVNSAFAVITAATTPILFAALSRLQFDRAGYKSFFFRFQFSVSTVLLPLGVGLFFFRDFVTDLLLGPQWGEAALMLGAWAATSAFNMVLTNYYSEVFRSLGRPRVSALSQGIYLLVMIPSLYLAALDGFQTLVIVQALVRIVSMGISQVLVFLLARIGVLQVLKNLYPPILAVTAMGMAAWLLAGMADGGWGLSAAGIVVCSLVYGLACLCFSRTRKLLLDFAAAGLKRLRRA